MQKTFTLHKDYTLFNNYYQLVLPLDLNPVIPADDPVRLLSQFIERMFLGELYRTYCREGRENEPTPRQLLKIVIYAYMNHIYSSRGMENACRRDINFMWLLEGQQVPDHATFARFRSLHVAHVRSTLWRKCQSFYTRWGKYPGKPFL